MITQLDPGSLTKARAGTLPLTPDPSVSPRRTRLSPRRRTEEEAGCNDFKKKRRRANSDYTTSMLETEKKAKTELSSENQRLKDENGALIRVISKLSK
ncbi:hypothetical protein CRUP_004649 [Coryphaenoides rupestris]|nr:hypothetical protein CRUP_004649 [Coryphaenoides rupestris]